MIFDYYYSTYTSVFRMGLSDTLLLVIILIPLLEWPSRVLLRTLSEADVHRRRSKGCLTWQMVEQFSKALERGDLAAAKELISKRADVNARDMHGNSPLDLAALRCKEDFINVRPGRCCCCCCLLFAKLVVLFQDFSCHASSSSFRTVLA